MRIAIAEVGQETCSFTSVRTTVDTFRQYGLHEGEEIFTHRVEGTGTLGGYFAALAEEPSGSVTTLPIISAWAGASGALTAETLEFFRTKIIDGLKALLPIDGFFFCLHGAAAADNDPDVEGALLEAARQVLGTDIPIVSPFDHHANITARMIANLDGLVGHRTQPHDPYETSYLAAKLLFAMLNGAAKPTMAWHKIPLFTHQEQFLTSRPPMKSWFDRARAMEKLPGVLSASTFPIQPWLDVPEGGWSTVVITNNDPALAEKLSYELAEMAWSMREQFWVYESIPVADAVRQAIAAEQGLVILSDTGDSVFGGATGDSTVILRELVHQQAPCSALVPIVDGDVARKAHAAGVGATLQVQLGGKLDPLSGQPLDVTAEVVALDEGKFESSVNYRSTFDMGKCALLAIGKVKVVVSENVGIGGNHPIVYRRFGIEPADAKIAVLKTASNFQYYADMTAQIIRVNTPGPTMSDLEQFNWQHIPRPTYPFDPISDWQPKASTAA